MPMNFKWHKNIFLIDIDSIPTMVKITAKFCVRNRYSVLNVKIRLSTWL